MPSRGACNTLRPFCGVRRERFTEDVRVPGRSWAAAGEQPVPPLTQFTQLLAERRSAEARLQCTSPTRLIGAGHREQVRCVDASTVQPGLFASLEWRLPARVTKCVSTTER